MKKATIHDYGYPEYLDGAEMQFCVCNGKYPRGETLAYFSSKEDAELFVKAKNDSLRPDR